LKSRRRFRQPPPTIVADPLLQLTTRARKRSLLRLQPEARHELKGLRLSGHEKSAIVKADRDPTIFAALDYFADLTLQRYLGSPCESFSDQPDSIANLESAPDHGNLLSFRLQPEFDQAPFVQGAPSRAYG
jgi:hypothetical protein